MSRRGICDLDIGVSSGPVEKIAAESWRCAEWTGSPSDREGQAMIGSSPTNASLPIFENFGSWVYELCVKSQNMDFTPHLFMGGGFRSEPKKRDGPPFFDRDKAPSRGQRSKSPHLWWGILTAAESTGFGRDLFSLQRFAGIGEKDSSRLKHLRFRGETSRFLFPFLEEKERVPKHNQKWPIFC